MPRRRCSLLLLFASVLLLPNSAHAGMPSITLTDITRLRLQTISFFLMGVLASAWVVRVAWNILQRDFPRLPQLSYGRSLAVVMLWGLVFILVLTMISGARELMTPGAWERQGWTYRLADEAPASAAAAEDGQLWAERRAGLAQLGTALLSYAVRNEGYFPSEEDFDALDDDLKSLPGLTGVYYFYVPERVASDVSRILAYEPNVYGDESLVLMSDGLIQSMTPAELREVLDNEGGL